MNHQILQKARDIARLKDEQNLWSVDRAIGKSGSGTLKSRIII
ncbi:MAG: hypothetical protein RID53_32340 [Coleofasciculus sp. B1-GNL1-01]